MESIRSLHLNSETSWRGGEAQTLLLLTALAARGHEISLACPAGAPLGQRAAAVGIQVHHVAMRSDADLASVAQLRRILRAERPQVCQLHTPHAHSLGALARGFSRSPRTIVTRRVIFSIHRHGVLGLNRLKYRLGADHIIAVSAAVKAVLVQDGIGAGGITVVTDGTDPLPPAAVSREEIRSRFGLTPGHSVIGSVAHLSPRKGQIHLVQAMGLLRQSHPMVRCLIVGEGEERPRLEAEIQRLDLHGVVHLAGFQQDVAAYLQGFDCFAMPSLAEGLCTSILDALHQELPVVASDIGGIPEIIRDHDTGLLVPVADAPALAVALARILDDPAAARAMASRGRGRAEAEFSVARMVEGTLAVYRRLLAGA